MPRKFSVKTRGVSFMPGYPDNLLGLMRRQAEGWTQRLVLMADDDNTVDDMAVMVVLDAASLERPDVRGMAALGHDFILNYQLGHLPAALAAKVRPDIEDWEITSWDVLVVPSNPTNPGLELTCERRAA